TAQGGADALGRGAISIVGRGERDRLLGQTARHLEVVHLLERAHAPPRDRRATTDHKHRAVIALRLRQSGCAVEDTRPRRDRGDPSRPMTITPPDALSALPR